MPRGATNSAFGVLGKEKDGWRQWQSSWGIVRPLVNEQVKKLVIFHTQVVCPAVSYCKTFAYSQKHVFFATKQVVNQNEKSISGNSVLKLFNLFRSVFLFKRFSFRINEKD